MDSDTIAAIATPIGAGGIGIIRISGPDSKSIIETVFESARKHRGDANADMSKKEKLQKKVLDTGTLLIQNQKERLMKCL